MKEYQEGWEEFSNHTSFEVGYDFRIRFWYVVLVWGLGPQGSFSGLVQFVHCKDALAADLLKFSSDSHQWNVSFLIVA